MSAKVFKFYRRTIMYMKLIIHQQSRLCYILDFGLDLVFTRDIKSLRSNRHCIFFFKTNGNFQECLGVNVCQSFMTADDIFIKIT